MVLQSNATPEYGYNNDNGKGEDNGDCNGYDGRCKGKGEAEARGEADGSEGKGERARQSRARGQEQGCQEQADGASATAEGA